MNDTITIMLLTAFFTMASPGPSTLLLASTAMRSGRKTGLILACGTITGSATWNICTAFGIVTIITANPWFLEIIRYGGAVYLLYLAYGTGIATFKGEIPQHNTEPSSLTAKRAYMTGLLIHLTNPKVIIFYMSLYSIVLTGQESVMDIGFIAVLLLGLATGIFLGYALLFSQPRFMESYRRLHRWFNGGSALFFITASYSILTAQLNPIETKE